MSPLSPIASRDERMAVGDTPVDARRWTGAPDLVSVLLLPTLPELTAGYERFGAALADRGVSVTLALTELRPGGDAGIVAGLLEQLRDERGSPPVALAGHGTGGLVAAEYLESDRPQPDFAVLIGPTLGDARRRSVIETVGRRWIHANPTSRAQDRVAASFDRIRVRTYIQHGADDGESPPSGWFAWQRLPSSTVHPGEAVIYNRVGHDVPNEPGWRSRVDDLAAWLVRWSRERWPDIVPPAPDADRWEKLSRADATAAFEAVVAGEEDRLRRFRADLRRLGGPDPNPTRAAMARLGAWLLEAVEAGPRDGDLPDWVLSRSIGPMHRLSTESLWLADGAARHFAASLRSLEPMLHWELCTQRIDAYYHRTLLEPIHLDPSRVALSLVQQLGAEEPDADWLGQLWDARVASIHLARVDPTDMDADPLPLDEISVDAVPDGEWNAQVWIPEAAEAVLGERRFGRLADQIGRLAGIEAVAWEDRELILVRVAPEVDLDGLRRRVVGVVRRARRAAEAEQ